jgi:hypothetical protein
MCVCGGGRVRAEGGCKWNLPSYFHYPTLKKFLLIFLFPIFNAIYRIICRLNVTIWGCPAPSYSVPRAASDFYSTFYVFSSRVMFWSRRLFSLGLASFISSIRKSVFCGQQFHFVELNVRYLLSAVELSIWCIDINITATLPSDKLLIFFLKPLNLTPRHACFYHNSLTESSLYLRLGLVFRLQMFGCRR